MTDPVADRRLWGISEIAKAMDRHKNTAVHATRHPTFPKPQDRLAMGQVWDAAAVEKWLKEHRP